MTLTSVTCPQAAIPLDRCPLALALEVLHGKWTMPMLWWLARRPRRFGDLRRKLPGVTAKMLTVQLRKLERHGLVLRNVRPGRVTAVEYELNDDGRRLTPILDALCEWGRGYAIRHSEHLPAPARHGWLGQISP